MSTTAQTFRMNFPLRVILFALAVVGFGALFLIAKDDHTRAWFNYLIGSCLFLSLSLCGLFFTAIQHLTSARWSVSVRRIFEGMALTLPIAGILIAGVMVGVHHLYEWSHGDVVAKDVILQGKQGYLNQGFFMVRLIGYFVIWLCSTFYLVRNSLRQDISKEVSLTVRNLKASAIILVLFALSVTMASFDLLMSLEPHWFSTIFGIYFFAGLFQAGLAFMYLTAWYLYRTGFLSKVMNKYHFHDLGKFVFAFGVFWAYIGFSQFMLIWYGDLPEETFFYKVRMTSGWGWIGLSVLFLRFVIPFLILMPYRAKMTFKIALPICVLVLIGQWVDLFWIAMPAARLHGEVIHGFISPLEWVVGIGFMALFGLVLSFVLERIRIVPTGDPRLAESIHHHG